MARYDSMTAQVADMVLRRRYRHELDEGRPGDPGQIVIDVQAMYADPTQQQEATLLLAHLLFIRQELGEDAVRRVRDRHALAGSWR